MNPNSHGGKTGKEWDKQEKIISDYLGNNFSYKLADGIGTGTQITKDAIQEGCNTIISVGGEGTANEVLNGIIETDPSVPLGFIRSGTANDFLSENVYNWPIEIENQLAAIKTKICE